MGWMLRWMGAWLGAALVAAVSGSVWQTQVNLWALQRLGAEVGWAERWRTTLEDLAAFAPLWFLLLAAGLLLALPVAGWLGRRFGRRPLLHALAGGVTVATILLSMRLLLAITPIAAARSLPGFLGLVLCGALGAWCVAWFNRTSHAGRSATAS